MTDWTPLYDPAVVLRTAMLPPLHVRDRVQFWLDPEPTWDWPLRPPPS